jgi:hypothetical protein
MPELSGRATNRDDPVSEPARTYWIDITYVVQETITRK